MIRGIVVAASVMLCSSAAIAQTDASGQKTALEIEKLRTDIRKAQIEADNAMFSPLRSTTGGQAAVSSGEKTVEALFLARATLEGAAAQIADGLTKVAAPSAGVRPMIVWGRTPPSIAQWQSFRRERDRISGLIGRADEKAAVSSFDKSFLGTALLVGNIAAAVVPMIKTDTTIAGGAGFSDENRVRTAMTAALLRANYDPEVAEVAVADGEASATRLLAPLRPRIEAVRSRIAGSKKAPIAEDVAALAAYDLLEKSLYDESAGVIGATVVERQQRLAEQSAATPIIYLLNVDAAVTSTTKKGMFTGLAGSVPAFMSSSTVIDYVIVASGAPQSGTVRCTIEKIRITDIISANDLKCGEAA